MSTSRPREQRHLEPITLPRRPAWSVSRLGATTATVTVDPTADTVVEPDETVVFTLLPGAGYAIGDPSEATGTILNDDVSDVSVNVDPASILEDAAGVITFTFTRLQYRTTNSVVVREL